MSGTDRDFSRKRYLYNVLKPNIVLRLNRIFQTQNKRTKNKSNRINNKQTKNEWWSNDSCFFLTSVRFSVIQESHKVPFLQGLNPLLLHCIRTSWYRSSSWYNISSVFIGTQVSFLWSRCFSDFRYGVLLVTFLGSYKLGRLVFVYLGYSKEVYKRTGSGNESLSVLSLLSLLNETHEYPVLSPVYRRPTSYNPSRKIVNFDVLLYAIKFFDTRDLVVLTSYSPIFRILYKNYVI